MTGNFVHHNERSSGATSLSLLERVKTRDTAAWERLVNLYTPLVNHWAGRHLQEADMADIRQEVFLSVSRMIGEFERVSTSGSFRGWLRVITRNKICDYWRMRQKVREETGGTISHQLQEIPADFGQVSETDEFGILYQKALELVAVDFESRSWSAFWQVVVEERDPAAVAADLQMSLNAVYLAKGRVLARLREEFAGLIDS